MAEELDLKALQKRLKDAGEKGLARELNKGINSAMLPLKTAIPRSALKTLPRRGGLAKKVAASKLSVRKMSNGVRIVAKSQNKYELMYLDKPGLLRHPVFPRRTRVQKITGRNKGSAKLHANRKKWAWESQKVTPGYWSKPTDAAGRQARKDVVIAMENVVRQIEGR